MNSYYETCALISSKSSNNQNIIDNLEYYVFNNLMVYFTKIQEKEAGTGEGSNTTIDKQKNQASQQFSSSMRSAKQSMKSNTHKKR